MKIKQFVSAISMISVLTIPSDFADIPQPDFSPPTGPAYVKSLYASDSEPAVALKKAVANGWSDRQKAIAASKAAGIRLDIQFAPVSKDQDAAPYFKKWNEYRKKTWRGSFMNLTPVMVEGVMRYPEELDNAQKCLTDNPMVFKLLHLAVEKKRYGWNTMYGINDYAPLREAAREIISEGCLLAYQKRYDDALNAERDAFHIAGDAYQEKSVLGCLVGGACQSISLIGYQDLLTLGGDRPGYASKIADVIRNNAVENSVNISAANNETAYLFGQLESYRKNSCNEILVRSMPYITVGDPMLPKGQNLKTLTPSELKLWNNLIFQAEADFLNEEIRLLSINKNKSASQRQKLYSKEKLSSPALTALSSISPDLSSSFDLSIVKGLSDSNANEEAVIQITFAGCEAFDVKSKTGQFPDSLTGRITDPWTEKPIGYKKTVDGFIIYSVGEDHAFNGDVDKIPQGTYRRYYRYPIKLRSLPRE